MDKEYIKKESLEKLGILEAKIAEMQQRLEALAADAKVEARAAGEKKLEELKEAQKKLRVHLDAIQQAAGEKCDEALTAFDKLFDEAMAKASVGVNAVWEKLKRFFE